MSCSQGEGLGLIRCSHQLSSYTSALFPLVRPAPVYLSRFNAYPNAFVSSTLQISHHAILRN